MLGGGSWDGKCSDMLAIARAGTAQIKSQVHGHSAARSLEMKGSWRLVLEVTCLRGTDHETTIGPRYF